MALPFRLPCNCKSQTHPSSMPKTVFPGSLAAFPSISSYKFCQHEKMLDRATRTSIITHIDKSYKPYDTKETTLDDPLKIGIVGFGNFGQFLATVLKQQGHIVLATSRSDYSEYCQQHGIEFFRNVDGLCEEQPDIILVCSSILSTETVVRGIPMHKLKPDTIFVDVLSVKQFPRNLFFEVLPQEFGIICTHPMFGPESGQHGWAGLPFVYDKVRINHHGAQLRKCTKFLNIFEKECCRMVEMSCEEHDRHAAGSQFITHTIGRILSQLELESTPINTKGYETLLRLTENTISDSFDLYYGLFMYNVNATDQIENLDRAFDIVKQNLFGRLHDILRKQIIERVPKRSVQVQPTTSLFLPDNEKLKKLSSFALLHPSENNDEVAPSVPKEVPASQV